MTTSSFLHGVSGVVVETYSPLNCHAITLQIRRGDREDARITLFDLPEDRALALVFALHDEDSVIHSSHGKVMAKDYFTERAVHKALEVSDEDAV